MNFIIDKEENVKKLIADLQKNNIENIKFSEDVSYDFVLDIYKYVKYLDEPLFLRKENKEEYFKYHDNITFLKNLYLKLKSEEELPDFDYRERNHKEKVEKIVDGTYVFATLGKNYIYLDYKNYNFNSASEMFYSVGAYICNKIQYKDPREEGFKNNNELYIYKNNIDGDFRLHYYQIPDEHIDHPNEQTKLPFKLPLEKGSIIGYHSVEHDFLAALLKYIKDNKINSYIYNNYDKVFDQKVEFLEKIYGKVNFKIDYSNLIGIPTAKVYYPIIPSVSNNIHYEFKEESGNLVVYKVENNEKRKKELEINPDIVDSLINSLLEKSLKGNGREPIQLLRKVFDFFV